MSDLNCPYCDTELSVCHDDGFGYEEGVNHQMECDKCEKSFVFQTSISFYYEAEKADCLNDGNHDWKKNHTQPSCFTQMQCSMCGDRRELTTEERKEFNIQTKEEYFEELDKGGEQ
jgi:hypothetical protein